MTADDGNIDTKKATGDWYSQIQVMDGFIADVVRTTLPTKHQGSDLRILAFKRHFYCR